MSDAIQISRHGGHVKTKYVLQLFITGATPNSTRAIANIRTICEQHLKGEYELEIIDVYQEKEMAAMNQIVALPMLIKRFPLPERKLIGDLSKTAKVLEALGI
ncbi:MAG TPA: circadian clock KaiB family protein [Ohtaekwangia sp.]|nr:circadian clock KaiB family protein [Ohtaekwangia sp.]